MGGLIVALAVALIVSQFFFKSFPPNKRAIFTAASAWVICAAIWGLFLPVGFYGALVGFSIGAMLVGVERYMHYSKHWTDEPGSSDLTDTFR